MMPELDGFGVLEAMQARESTRDVPVVVLTAWALNEEHMKRLNAGVATILNKGLFSATEILGHSVTDIALDVGFTDLAIFSRVSHREVGVTPNAYRRAKQR